MMETLSARMPPSTVPENSSDSLTPCSTLPHFQICPRCDKRHFFTVESMAYLFPRPTNKFYCNWLGSTQCITTVTSFCYQMLHPVLTAAILHSLIMLCLSSGTTSQFPSTLIQLQRMKDIIILKTDR